MQKCSTNHAVLNRMLRILFKTAFIFVKNIAQFNKKQYFC